MWNLTVVILWITAGVSLKFGCDKEHVSKDSICTMVQQI